MEWLRSRNLWLAVGVAVTSAVGYAVYRRYTDAPDETGGETAAEAPNTTGQRVGPTRSGQNADGSPDIRRPPPPGNAATGAGNVGASPTLRARAPSAPQATAVGGEAAAVAGNTAVLAPSAAVTIPRVIEEHDMHHNPLQAAVGFGETDQGQV